MPEQLVDRARELVGRVLAEHRAELERLVDEELDRVIDVIVRERLAARNGNGANVDPMSDARTSASGPNVGPDRESPSASSPRLCATCNQRPAAQHRRVCNGCRERERRERRAAQAAAGGDAGP